MRSRVGAEGARILVVEDDRKVAEVVEEVLVSQGHEIDSCEAAEEGVRRLRDRRYDLVIVDIELPGVDGLELVSWIREAGDVIPIIVLTARGTTRDIVAGLERGADDYVTKPFNPGELRARVDALLRRGGGDETTLLRYEDVEVDVLRGRAWRGGRLLNLSPKELELLTCFVRRPNELLRSGELLREVWKGAGNSDTTVLRVTLSRLRRKLNEHGEPGLIQARRGVGFVFGREGGMKEQGAS